MHQHPQFSCKSMPVRVRIPARYQYRKANYRAVILKTSRISDLFIERMVLERTLKPKHLVQITVHGFLPAAGIGEEALNQMVKAGPATAFNCWQNNLHRGEISSISGL